MLLISPFQGFEILPGYSSYLFFHRFHRATPYAADFAISWLMVFFATVTLISKIFQIIQFYFTSVLTLKKSTSTKPPGSLVA